MGPLPTTTPIYSGDGPGVYLPPEVPQNICCFHHWLLCESTTVWSRQPNLKLHYTQQSRSWSTGHRLQVMPGYAHCSVMLACTLAAICFMRHRTANSATCFLSVAGIRPRVQPTLSQCVCVLVSQCVCVFQGVYVSVFVCLCLCVCVSVWVLCVVCWVVCVGWCVCVCWLCECSVCLSVCRSVCLSVFQSVSQSVSRCQCQRVCVLWCSCMLLIVFACTWLVSC